MKYVVIECLGAMEEHHARKAASTLNLRVADVPAAMSPCQGCGSPSAELSYGLLVDGTDPVWMLRCSWCGQRSYAVDLIGLMRIWQGEAGGNDATCYNATAPVSYRCSGCGDLFAEPKTDAGQRPEPDDLVACPACGHLQAASLYEIESNPEVR